MDKAISAVEANRHFSQVLRSVREGDSFVVTAHGKPVARIAPVRAEARIADEARRQLLARLRAAPVLDVGSWTRAELYQR